MLTIEPPAIAQPDNIVFYSSNDWGVPDLLPTHQAEYYTIPCVAWGTVSRKSDLDGSTILFYVDDYRFTSLWSKPDQLPRTGCYAAVEPNYTVSLESPKAWVLYSIFQRRWLARYWQSFGVRIYVDLNIPVEFDDLMLLGVPKGWRSYATRGYSDRLQALDNEYELAIAHAETQDILFLVYGGGKKVKDVCCDRGWYWTPEQQDRTGGRLIAVTNERGSDCG